jgi:large subunit ribosomal protein L15
MQSNTLRAKTKRKKSQQVGRGGTRGKTSGRGTKGQNARAGRKKRPELRDFIKRFPKLRGRGISSFKSREIKPFAVNLSLLEKHFTAGETVNLSTLIAKKIISIRKSVDATVKILSTGEISKALKFEGVKASASAKAKIEKAGGSLK